MGNSQQVIHTVTLVDLNQWKQIGIHRQTSKIVQNQTTQQLAELQSIPFNPKNNLQKQIEIYQYRKSQNNALVSCLAMTHQKAKSSSICGSSHTLKVLTQRIPYRLNQIQQLSFPQSIYVLSQSLRGYKDCYSKLGSFYVEDQMIGINTEGETKVWVNQNFAQNHPLIQKPLLQTSGSQLQQSIEQNLFKSKEQTQMVDNIMKVVEKKCESGHFPASFRQKVYQSPLTFDQAFRQIQTYVKEKGVFVPDRIISQTSSIKKSALPNLVTDSVDQRISYVPSNSFVSRPLFHQPQQNITQRISTFNNYPPKIIQQRINQPVKNFIPLQQENILMQRIPNHFPQVKNFPTTSKVTFRFISPDNAKQVLKERNNQ